MVKYLSMGTLIGICAGLSIFIGVVRHIVFNKVL